MRFIGLELVVIPALFLNLFHAAQTLASRNDDPAEVGFEARAWNVRQKTNPLQARVQGTHRNQIERCTFYYVRT